jgi:hypothetical protein
MAGKLLAWYTKPHSTPEKGGHRASEIDDVPQGGTNLGSVDRDDGEPGLQGQPDQEKEGDPHE